MPRHPDGEIPPGVRIHTGIRFEALALLDIPHLVEECRDPWFHQPLVRVGDSVVRLGVVSGEFHWHRHDREDEFFLVLSGRLLIDLGERTVELGPHQAITIPRGTRHRTRAPGRTVMLMVSGAGIRPEGDGASAGSS